MAAIPLSKSTIACAVLALALALLTVEVAQCRALGGDEEPAIAEEEGEDQTRECSGYRPGNPGMVSDIPGCKTGSDIGVVDHMYAFGFSPLAETPNWTACGLPTLPQENQRVCYRTTVAQCEDGYRIYLNKRNLETLQMSCPNETNEIPLSSSSSAARFLQSPRYSCQKPPYGRRDNLFTYRKSDFCLYDIFIPDCPSGRVIVENKMHYTQELERRHRYHICSDYLQFYFNATASKRYCDTELSRIELEIPTTHFRALFWTDTSFNKLGFKLRVSCVHQDSD